MPLEYRHGEHHVYRHVAGEHLLISLHRDAVAPMFAFSPTAAAVWTWLDGWSTPAVLAARLCERFDVGPERAAEDVGEFLEQLKTIGAVEVRERTQ
jgi:Coenzyme PQQ synthesis protein D (PqqD)